MYVVKRSKHNPILLPDRDHYWEASATFNMSVVKKGRTFYGFYRALSARDVMRTALYTSVVAMGESKDGIHFEKREPFITPTEGWEKFGCEDPRATYFEGKYYIFYTALSKYPFEASGIKVAVAISKDLKTIKERHLVTPFNAKAMVLFPERVKGKILVMMTVNTDMPPAKVAIAELDYIEQLWDEHFWKKWYAEVDKHSIELKRSDKDHVEVGAVPLKTKQGWLLIYSHIQNYFSSNGRVFGVEAVLLDSNNPLRILGRTKNPILAPEETYELSGYVPNIVFPTSAIIEKDTLHIYYGAADTSVCVASVNIQDLLGTMLGAPSYVFHRFAKNPIIKPKPEHPWEGKATMNPAAIRLGGKTHILYRTLSNDDTSYIGYAVSTDGLHIDERLPEPIYVPREDFESKKVSGNSGCEDPRITKIGKTLYICYTAFDGIGPPRVAVSSITEADFLNKKWNWEKPVLITPAGFDDKDTCLLEEPIKIDGKDQYFVLHRVGGEVCGDYFDSLDFKTQTVKKCVRIIGARTNSWDELKVGIASPPMKTKKGWLLLYHGISKADHGYRVGAVLLDLKDPAIVLARTADPIFEAVEPYEKNGIVNNVVFPCGSVIKDKLLYIYYGGADMVTGVATIDLNTVVKALSRPL